ncbi:MAG TPA: hypothetical protein QF753_18450 [Victivallales bacterium]|nr:hypothetical protein [Victivallales bacterium]
MPLKSLMMVCLIYVFSFPIIGAVEPAANLAGLVYQDGKYYKHPSEGPYSGRVYRHFSNGKKSFEINLHNGELNGVWKVWYTNGKLKKKMYYKSGKLSGPYEIWYSNGNKFLHFDFVNGHLQKQVDGWYKNGNKWFVDVFNHGKTDGVLSIWNENGEFASKIIIPEEGLLNANPKEKNKDIVTINTLRRKIILERDNLGR